MSDALDRLWPLVRQLQGAMGGKTFRSGTDTATWAASPFAGSVVVSHGLGRTPTFAAAHTRNGLVGYAVTARSATTITVDGFITDNTNRTLTLTFDWEVRG